MHDEIQKLRATITELQAELEGVESRDPEVRRLLATALQDITAKLHAAEAGDPPAAPAPAPEEFAETARRLEVDHPTLAATLRGVVEALTRMGI
jgi:phytoene/squalene synthetase